MEAIAEPIGLHSAEGSVNIEMGDCLSLHKIFLGHVPLGFPYVV